MILASCHQQRIPFAQLSTIRMLPDACQQLRQRSWLQIFWRAGTDSTVLTIPVKALECSGADRGSAMSDLTDKAAVK